MRDDPIELVRGRCPLPGVDESRGEAQPGDELVTYGQNALSLGVDDAAPAAGAAEVEGSTWRWRVDPEALAAADREVDGRVALLNPYDSVLFDRPRLAEAFDFDYVLEQFKPRAQRRYGFFAHPVLMGDRFVGMVDAEVDRDNEVLRVNAVHEFVAFDAEETDMVRAEITDLAEWLGVRVSGLA